MRLFVWLSSDLTNVVAECGANLAASNGHLHVVRKLRANGMHCTDLGADCAASDGHVHVLEDLAQHGIYCTTAGADNAATYGHLHVVKYLYKHGIRCTPGGECKADWYVQQWLSQLQKLEDSSSVLVPNR